MVGAAVIRNSRFLTAIIDILRRYTVTKQPASVLRNCIFKFIIPAGLVFYFSSSSSPSFLISRCGVMGKILRMELPLLAKSLGPSVVALYRWGLW